MTCEFCQGDGINCCDECDMSMSIAERDRLHACERKFNAVSAVYNAALMSDISDPLMLLQMFKEALDTP